MSRLRLLLVTDAVGGVWVYSLELARALASQGFETILAVTGPSPNPEQREAARGLRLIDTGLPLEWLDTSGAKVRRAAEELAAIAAREQVDLVQTSSAALIAGAPFDRPCIAVQHSCVATWWAAVKRTSLPADFEWRHELVQDGLQRAAAIIAPTDAFARATQRAYALDRPVHCVHNGRSPQQTRPIPQGHFVFTAGRLWDEGKNAALLDRVARRMDTPFQAAGPIRGANGAAADLVNLSLLGELSETRMAGLFAARPVYASAALYEPFGLSVLEAAQAGCALVLSDIETHRELWDGAALFIDPRDEDRFADEIGRVLNDKKERDRLGRDARERARNYSPEVMARAMADIYMRVARPQRQLLAGAA